MTSTDEFVKRTALHVAYIACAKHGHQLAGRMASAYTRFDRVTGHGALLAWLEENGIAHIGRPFVSIMEEARRHRGYTSAFRVAEAQWNQYRRHVHTHNAGRILTTTEEDPERFEKEMRRLTFETMFSENPKENRYWGSMSVANRRLEPFLMLVPDSLLSRSSSVLMANVPYMRADAPTRAQAVPILPDSESKGEMVDGEWKLVKHGVMRWSEHRKREAYCDAVTEGNRNWVMPMTVRLQALVRKSIEQIEASWPSRGPEVSLRFHRSIESISPRVVVLSDIEKRRLELLAQIRALPDSGLIVTVKEQLATMRRLVASEVEASAVAVTTEQQSLARARLQQYVVQWSELESMGRYRSFLEKSTAEVEETSAKSVVFQLFGEENRKLRGVIRQALTGVKSYHEKFKENWKTEREELETHYRTSFASCIRSDVYANLNVLLAMAESLLKPQEPVAAEPSGFTSLFRSSGPGAALALNHASVRSSLMTLLETPVPNEAITLENVAAAENALHEEYVMICEQQEATENRQGFLSSIEKFGEVYRKYASATTAAVRDEESKRDVFVHALSESLPREILEWTVAKGLRLSVDPFHAEITKRLEYVRGICRLEKMDAVDAYMRQLPAMEAERQSDTVPFVDILHHLAPLVWLFHLSDRLRYKSG